MTANFETGLKICGRCRVEQPIANFGLHSKACDKLQNDCAACKRIIAVEWRRKNPERSKATNNAWNAKNREKVNAWARRSYRRNAVKRAHKQRQRRHGLLPHTEDELTKVQDGKCPGCLNNLSEVTRHIDHDHATGKVRGILCQKCNMSLGLLKDDPEILIRLANYLRKAKLEV
jgi:Autographiviridae endonuclease VII